MGRLSASNASAEPNIGADTSTNVMLRVYARYLLLYLYWEFGSTMLIVLVVL